MFSDKRISYKQIDGICRVVYPETDSEILTACMQDGRVWSWLPEKIEEKLEFILALQKNINDVILEEDIFSQKSANQEKKDVFWRLFVGYQMVQSHTYATGVLRCENEIFSKEENKRKLRELFALQKALFDFALKHQHTNYFDWSTRAIKKNWEKHMTNDPYFFPQNAENKRTLQVLENKLGIPANESLMVVINQIEENKNAPAAALRKRKVAEFTTAAAIDLLLKAASAAEPKVVDTIEQENKRLRKENTKLKEELAQLQDKYEQLKERRVLAESGSELPNFHTPKTVPRGGGAARAASPFSLADPPPLLNGRR